MRTLHAKRSRGFVLIEALIALLIVSVGLLAISKLETLTLSAAGEARSRSEAVTLAQKKLEQLRNWVVESGFNSGMVDGGPVSVSGTNATYTFTWNIGPTAGGSLVQLNTRWTDRFGTPQQLDLNSLVSWDDPYNQLKGQAGFTGISAPSPSGQAKRGTTDYGNNVPQGATTNTDGSGTKTYVKNDNTVELIDSAGKVVLYLDPTVDGQAQSFTTISGRVYFDQNAGNNAIPDANNVRVRLSSEGQCFYDNAVNSLSAEVTAGSNSYKYFSYVCYVGPEWWGNVAVVVDDSVNGQAASPTLCVGDPLFNSGVNDGTLISANPVEASVRSYRGFYDQGVNASPRYLTTGMQGGTNYPYDTVNSNITGRGSPLPLSYPSYYPSVNANNGTNYFNQHFLITHISGQGSCYTKMLGGEFTRNAGQYFCISPDDDSDNSDACPSIWPGFEGAVGNGGQINYTLSLVKAGGGTGTVTSSPTGISCDANCTSTSGSFATGTTVTLTPSPANGSTFAGWSGGGCSGTGTCVVTLTGATSVSATFELGTTTYNLGITVAGTGTVTSDTGGISCPGTCSANYNANTVVTLTSTAGGGYTFTGWGGACSGSSATCSVTMDAVKSVTATYVVTPVPYDLTVTKSSAAGGTVTSSPSGINCGTSCTSETASFASGTTVTLTATAESGYGFTGWSGACSGTGTCTVTMSNAQNVTATFGAICTTPISGSAVDKHGAVSIVTTVLAGSSCSMNGGGSSGYSCSLTTYCGSSVTLRNLKTTGNPTYDVTLSVTANGATQTNVNFVLP
jgi:uncharacterized repeat protein (TIGR02543 family)